MEASRSLRSGLAVERPDEISVSRVGVERGEIGLRHDREEQLRVRRGETLEVADRPVGIEGAG